jgi:hypothetical protein
VRYRVEIARPDERSGLLRIEGSIDDGPWQPLAVGGGMLLRIGEGVVLPPFAAHERCPLRELSHGPRGRIVVVRYTEELDGAVLHRSVEYRMVGRSLEIFVQAPALPGGEGYCGFSLGNLGPDGARKVTVPGISDPLIFVDPEGYLAAYVDRLLGAASAYPPGGAFYRPDTAGVNRPIAETFYVTLSPDPLDPLPALRQEPAPLCGTLRSRVTLDFFSEAPFRDDAEFLRLLGRYGVEDVLLIYRNWQQFGYRKRTPALHPANPDRGGAAGFRHLLKTTAEAGWLVAPREEYATLGQDSPYWDERCVSVWPDGTPRQPRHARDYSVAAHRMIEFARLEASHIRLNYPVTAAFVDGHTAWDPEFGLRQVDSRPGSPSGMVPQAIRRTADLLEFLREAHRGPIIGSAGEGAARFDTFAAGAAEAVVRGPDEGAGAPLILDYELREVHPRLVGIGAGTYRQFCGHPAGVAVDPGSVDWDVYRATEIALGHGGYVGNYRIKPGPRGMPFPGGSSAVLVREYFLLRALQERYLDVHAVSVGYWNGEEFLPLAQALRSLDLTQARVRIQYDNGLTLWVNRSKGESWSLQTADGAWTLPPTGFLALTADRSLLAYSATVGGSRTDFCRSADYTFLDTRSAHPRTAEGITVDGSVVVRPCEVELGFDVTLVAARQLKIEGEELLLSERGDLRFRYRSPEELEITVLDTESGKPAHVAWTPLTADWKALDRLHVLELEGEHWVPSRAQLSHTRTGPQLARAHPGVVYRVRLLEV